MSNCVILLTVMSSTYFFVGDVGGVSFIFEVTDVETAAVPANLLRVVLLL
jgi:hypothetical protein